MRLAKKFDVIVLWVIVGALTMLALFDGCRLLRTHTPSNSPRPGTPWHALGDAQ